MKKEIIKELGKGEDLLLTHLAHQIGLTRQEEYLAVTAKLEYVPMFEE
jgi:hypothetical protein